MIARVVALVGKQPEDSHRFFSPCGFSVSIVGKILVPFKKGEALIANRSG